MSTPAGRVLIVTAAMGAGHVTIAAEVRRRLEQRGVAVAVVDLIEDVPHAGSRLKQTYRLLLDHAPWLYDAAMRFWQRFPAPLERLTAAGDRRFGEALRAAVARHNPDVIVCDYNLGAQCLGRLRRRGEVAAPVLTLVTDPGAHPYWVSDGVDRYLAFLPRTVADLQRMGARAEQVRLVLRPQFGAAPDREAARAARDLHGRVVLVNAGSWAVGGVRDTVDALTGSPHLTVAVLCGRDDALRRELAARNGVVAVGWTDDVAGWLAAADVVVDNAGGLTCWEALSLRRPVVMYRPLPGHGRINVQVLADSGLVQAARTAGDLRAAVWRAEPAPFEPAGADITDVVLGCVAEGARA